MAQVSRKKRKRGAPNVRGPILKKEMFLVFAASKSFVVGTAPCMCIRFLCQDKHTAK